MDKPRVHSFWTYARFGCSQYQQAHPGVVFSTLCAGMLCLALVGCEQPTQPIPVDEAGPLARVPGATATAAGVTQNIRTHVDYSIEVNPRRVANSENLLVRLSVTNRGREPVVLPPGHCGRMFYYYVVDVRGEMVFSEEVALSDTQCGAVDFPPLRLNPGETWFPQRGGSSPPPDLSPGTYRFYVTDAFGTPARTAPVVVKVTEE